MGGDKKALDSGERFTAAVKLVFIERCTEACIVGWLGAVSHLGPQHRCGKSMKGVVKKDAKWRRLYSTKQRALTSDPRERSCDRGRCGGCTCVAVGGGFSCVLIYALGFFTHATTPCGLLLFIG